MDLKEYVELDKNYLLQVFSKPDLVIEKGDGVYLYDISGNKYLDFVSGIAVNLFGHNDKGLKEVIRNQIDKLIHVSNLYHNIPQIELAKLLVDNTIKSGKVFFTNSGTESNEGAIKFARIYSIKRKGALAYKIVAAKNSFHGRTFGSLSITGQPKFWKNLGPTMENVEFIEYGSIEDLERVIDKNTAALFLEPLQAEGGINEADISFWKKVKQVCEENDCLLVLDEVQTGLCRTGPLFGYKDLMIEPDIITLAKGLGHGIPLGAIIIKDKVAEYIDKGMHGSTLGGNPLACSVGNYVLNRLIDDGFENKVRKIGNFFKEELNKLKEKHPDKIEKVKGKGLILGLKLKNENISSIIDLLRENYNILITRAGVDVLRFLPPLIIEKSHIEYLVNSLNEVLGSRT